VALRRFPSAGDDFWLTKHRPDLINHGGFNLGGRNAAYRAGSCTMFQDRLADIVAIKLAALACVGRRERRTVRPVDQPFEQCGCLGARIGRPLAGAFLQDRMNLVPDIALVL
jgi:hypothetical protein